MVKMNGHKTEPAQFNLEEELQDLITQAVNEEDMDFQDVYDIFKQVLNDMEEELDSEDDD